MRTIFNKVLGNPNDKAIKQLLPMVAEINALEADYKAMSDDELRSVSEQFRAQLADGLDLDDLLPDAFAACREAARRTL